MTVILDDLSGKADSQSKAVRPVHADLAPMVHLGACRFASPAGAVFSPQTLLAPLLRKS